MVLQLLQQLGLGLVSARQLQSVQTQAYISVLDASVVGTPRSTTTFLVTPA
jgi:hypothetical protein